MPHELPLDDTIKVAIIQQSPIFLNLMASIEKAETAIHQAADAGASLAAFAECWLTGYPVWLDFSPDAALWDHPGAKALFARLSAEAIDLKSAIPNRLQALADKRNIIIVMGSHERLGGSLYNTSLSFVPQTPLNIHRKLIPTYTERLVWGQGDGSTLKAATSSFGPIGTLICWEHWMPLARATMHSQQEIIHIAQWPVVKDMHLIASRHYAFEGRVPVIAAGSFLRKSDIIDGYCSGPIQKDALALLEAMPGDRDAILHRGGSCVVGANGDLLTEQLWDKEAIVYATIDLKAAQAERLTLDTNGHYSRPDIFELHVQQKPQIGVVFKG